MVAVPVDVGKCSAAAMACDFTGRVLVPPVEFAMTRDGLLDVVERIERGLPGDVAHVRVGVEAAGHYHRPLVTPGAWPLAWEVVMLNPAHVTAQRRVNGQRGVKSDAVDLLAIADLLLAGRGVPVPAVSEAVVELSAWVGLRMRRVEMRKAIKQQLLGQLDQAFPGLTLALPDVLGTKVGRLVAAEFSEPARLTGLGVERFRRFAARRGVTVSRTTAARLVAAARVALPTFGAHVAREVLATDVALLADLEAQIAAAEERLTVLLPRTEYAVLTCAPG